jgi:putative peptidoglycan lipid II flippase
VKIGLIALVVNFALSVLLAWWLTLAGYAATHAGLALAVSVAAMVNAALLYRGLRAEGLLGGAGGWWTLLARVLAASAAMVLLLLQLVRPLDWWLRSGLGTRTLWLLLEVAAGGGVYFAVLLLLGLRLNDFRLRHR